MLNTPDNDRDDILERLRHPEREAERRRPGRLFLVRNTLNCVFIVMALVAMVGIVADGRGNHTMIWYGLGLFAVVIKMTEVLLRMPGMRNKLRK